MPSVVVEVKVKVGDKVGPGQAVVVLESMKTETVLRADAAGVVKAVGCANGEMVEEGRDLVEIEIEIENVTIVVVVHNTFDNQPANEIDPDSQVLTCVYGGYESTKYYDMIPFM